MVVLLTVVFVREDFRPESDAKAHASAAHVATAKTNRGVMIALLLTAMMVLLANMSIEPIITVYISHLHVPTDHLARTAGIVMACSAFGSMLTAARLGALADRNLIRLSLDGDRIVSEERLLGDLGKRIRDVRVGADGKIYVLTDEDDGQLLELTPPAAALP